MLSRLTPVWKKFFCCTGYEVVTVVTPPTGSGTPPTTVTISAPPGKYMIDHEPYPTRGPGAPAVELDGVATTATLPDGRVLPTGWTGKAIWQTSLPPTPIELTIHCING
jgi:hypothetical protein